MDGRNLFLIELGVRAIRGGDMTPDARGLGEKEMPNVVLLFDFLRAHPEHAERKSHEFMAIAQNYIDKKPDEFAKAWLEALQKDMN